MGPHTPHALPPFRTSLHPTPSTLIILLSHTPSGPACSPSRIPPRKGPRLSQEARSPPHTLARPPPLRVPAVAPPTPFNLPVWSLLQRRVPPCTLPQASPPRTPPNTVHRVRPQAQPPLSRVPNHLPPPLAQPPLTQRRHPFTCLKTLLSCRSTGGCGVTGWRRLGPDLHSSVLVDLSLGKPLVQNPGLRYLESLTGYLLDVIGCFSTRDILVYLCLLIELM